VEEIGHSSSHIKQFIHYVDASGNEKQLFVEERQHFEQHKDAFQRILQLLETKHEEPGTGRRLSVSLFHPKDVSIVGHRIGTLHHLLVLFASIRLFSIAFLSD
jgi:hypothetical protein